MPNCARFEQTTEKTSFGQQKDSCLKCGRNQKSHTPTTKGLEINIFFGGKLWKFQNWEEARERGFYLY